MKCFALPNFYVKEVINQKPGHVLFLITFQIWLVVMDMVKFRYSWDTGIG